MQYGVAYSNDSAALATSTQPDEGACCQACFVHATCVHWDWERSTGICRFRPDMSTGTTADMGHAIRRDDGRVAGSRNGVSAYVMHQRYAHPGGFSAIDPAARWISSLPTAFVPFGNRIMASAWAYTSFYKTFLVPPTATAAAGDGAGEQQAPLVNVTLTISADDAVVVLVNNQPVGRTLPEDFQQGAPPIMMRFALQGGSRHLIVLQCRSTGGPAVVVATLTAPDGAVLARTDYSWLWIQ
ncbi:hypothetical protein PLESTM_001139600 [Pleodorina starrii]|nr:hypothetical protein PLESTM_001139600 [Pleodorina starrii]